MTLGTQLENRPRYIVSTCFETFPFPGPTGEQREAIAEAARELNELREGWLNPPGMPEFELRKRTLTNLYNSRPTWLQTSTTGWTGPLPAPTAGPTASPMRRYWSGCWP